MTNTNYLRCDKGLNTAPNKPLLANNKGWYTAAFVCLSAYPLFDKHVQACICRMETRSVFFAKALGKTDRWETLFAVHDHGQGKSVTIDDVELLVDNNFAQWVKIRLCLR